MDVAQAAYTQAADCFQVALRLDPSNPQARSRSIPNPHWPFPVDGFCYCSLAVCIQPTHTDPPVACCTAADDNRRQAVHGLVQQVRWLKELADSNAMSPRLGAAPTVRLGAAPAGGLVLVPEDAGAAGRAASGPSPSLELHEGAAFPDGEGGGKSEGGDMKIGIAADLVGWNTCPTLADAGNQAARAHIEYQMEITNRSAAAFRRSPVIVAAPHFGALWRRRWK